MVAVADTAKCPEHPEREAVGTCARCGRFVCVGCAARRAPPTCSRCLETEIDPLVQAARLPFGMLATWRLAGALFLRRKVVVLISALVVSVRLVAYWVLVRGRFPGDNALDFSVLAAMLGLIHPIALNATAYAFRRLSPGSAARHPLGPRGLMMIALHAILAAALTTIGFIGFPVVLVVPIGVVGSASFDLVLVDGTLFPKGAPGIMDVLSEVPFGWPRFLAVYAATVLPGWSITTFGLPLLVAAASHGLPHQRFPPHLVSALLSLLICASIAGLVLHYLVVLSAWLRLRYQRELDRE